MASMLSRVGLAVAASLLMVQVSQAAVESTLVVASPDKMPAQLLSNEDNQKIAMLQQRPSQSYPLSEVSPNDAFVMAVSANRVGLLSVKDGQLFGIPPIPENYGFAGARTFGWRNDTTLTGIGFDLETGNAVLLTLSLETGVWSAETLDFPIEALVSIAPNASRALLAVVDEQIQFLVYDLVSKEITDVGTLDLTFQNFTAASWSQDGSRLAYVLRAMPDRISSRARLDGVLINSFVGRDVLGRLPPGENPALLRNEVRVFNFADGTKGTLAARNGDGGIYTNASWSTDGQTLMTQLDYPTKLRGRTYPSYLIPSRTIMRFYDASLKVTRQVPLADSLASGKFVSPDEVILQMMSGTNLWLYYYNRVSGEMRRISDRPGSYGLYNGFVATRQSRQVIFDYSSFSEPLDMYRINWDGKALYRLTWGNADLGKMGAVRSDPVSFKVGRDTFNGVLLQSANAAFPPKNKPIVVWQEGGPFSPMFNMWAANVENPFNLLPNFGYAVLVVPLQGRFGMGGTMLNALADGTNFGSIDIDTQAAIAQQMITRGWTSRGKIGITGCSYGGYFTLQSIVRHPTVYSAANAQCGLYDLIVEWNRGYPDLMAYLQQGTVLQNVDEFKRDSPAYNTEKIKTPILVFHGSRDFLPVTIAENFFQTVKDNGTPSRMVKFMGAGHGLGPFEDIGREESIVYQQYAAQEQINWFRTYLKP